MLKSFSRLLAWLSTPAEIDLYDDGDPLRHPALDRMNERELGDLPMSPPDSTKAGQRPCPA